jgi:hypothetical protein
MKKRVIDRGKDSLKPTSPSKPTKGASAGGSAKAQRSEVRSRDERLDARAMRETLQLSSHAAWNPSTKRRDRIAVLEESNRDRLPELVPIRYGRMLRSPFTFLRGSAGSMAYDLATTPTTQIKVQCCGDCHLMNFGMVATSERNLIFSLLGRSVFLPGRPSPPPAIQGDPLLSSRTVGGQERLSKPGTTGGRGSTADAVLQRQPGRGQVRAGLRGSERAGPWRAGGGGESRTRQSIG